MTEDKKLDRRAFLRRAAQIGAVAAVAPAMLSMTTACKKKDDGGGAGGGDGFSCDDTSGLTDDEIANRESLEYVDKSPKGKAEDCENCALYLQPEDGEDCGGCSLIAGPIHPDGHCTSWVAA